MKYQWSLSGGCRSNGCDGDSQVPQLTFVVHNKRVGEPDYGGDGNVGSYCGGGGACSGDLSDFLQMVTATSSFSRVGCVSDTPPCHCRDLPLLEDKPG